MQPRQTFRSIAAVGAVLAVLLSVVATSGCVPMESPAPSVMRTGAPPWDAPRDAVAYIDAAGLPQEMLGTSVTPYTLTLQVNVGGRAVDVPPFIGIDRVRAVQAPVHTHEPGGTIWLEGARTDTITLGQFFTLWGVRFDTDCLGSSCGSVKVTADGKSVADPQTLKLREVTNVVVTA